MGRDTGAGGAVEGVVPATDCRFFVELGKRFGAGLSSELRIDWSIIAPQDAPSVGML